jgi:hypothetical protein
MKKISKLFLFGSLFLILLTAACGANQNGTPTLSGTSIMETSTPFLGLGTPVAGTVTTAIATTGSEMPIAGGAQGVATQTSEVGSTIAGATATPNPAIPVTGSEITLVDCQFCVENLAHALLVLPDVSTFQVVSPTPSTTANNTAAVSCSTIEVNNGKQVVLCSGPASTPVMLTICTNGSCTNFPVNLQACPLAQQPQQAATTVPGKTKSAPVPGAASVTPTAYP